MDEVSEVNRQDGIIAVDAGKTGIAEPVPIKPELVKRHSIIVRLTHWINVLCFILLLMSGLAIFNAHPALYWGHYGYRGLPPLMGIGAMIDSNSRELVGITQIAGR